MVVSCLGLWNPRRIPKAPLNFFPFFLPSLMCMNIIRGEGVCFFASFLSLPVLFVCIARVCDSVLKWPDKTSSTGKKPIFKFMVTL